MTAATLNHVNLPGKLDSVLAAVAADLLDGLSITHKDCWLRHGSNRLSHHIYVLRGDGWLIESPEITVKTVDGRKSSIALYHLHDAFIDRAGQRGMRFVAAVREARAALRRAA